MARERARKGAREEASNFGKEGVEMEPLRADQQGERSDEGIRGGGESDEGIHGGGERELRRARPTG
eukprot:496511-Pleurochrysis_carterae.AAC.1